MQILTPTDLTAARLITPVAQLNARGKRIGTEYDASFDGEYIGSFPTYVAAETALDDYVHGLVERGLIVGAVLES